MLTTDHRYHAKLTAAVDSLIAFITSCEYIAADGLTADALAELSAITRISSQRSLTTAALTSALADQLRADAVALSQSAETTYTDMVARLSDVSGLYYDIVSYYTNSRAQLQSAIAQLTAAADARSVNRAVSAFADYAAETGTLTVYDTAHLYAISRQSDAAAHQFYIVAADTSNSDATRKSALTAAIAAAGLARRAAAAESAIDALTAIVADSAAERRYYQLLQRYS